MPPFDAQDAARQIGKMLPASLLAKPRINGYTPTLPTQKQEGNTRSVS